MAQTKDDKKRIAIRDAVMSDVVENGVGQASMSKIASRAAVSAGTLYIYYPNKHEMLQSVFLEIKSILHSEMIEAYDGQAETKDRLKAMWFTFFHFMVKNPNMFLFHEVMSNENILTDTQRSEMAVMASEIRGRIEAAVSEKVLKSVPTGSLMSLYIAPAVYYARQIIDKKQTLDAHDLDQLWSMVWDGISLT